MATGVKRDINGNARAKSTPDAPRGRFHDLFEGFRDELDQHHDRRERIIKASRDVTAQSKKIIFTLQRAKQINQEIPEGLQKDITSRLAEITKLLDSISPDLESSVNRYRYASSLRCLEELVEALSFAFYLRNQRLISPTEAQDAVPSNVVLTVHDYLYGVFDLFGEMMRFATVTTAQTGKLAGSAGNVGEAGDGDRNILSDMQLLGCSFEELPVIPTKDFRQKLETMRQSVQKVERLGYGLVVRGSERPKGWVPDMKVDIPEPSSPA